MFEEWGGDPSGIFLVKRRTGSVCADIFDSQPTFNKTRQTAQLLCPPGQKISQIKFASFGWPEGKCGSYTQGKCHAQKSYDPFQQVWLNLVTSILASI